MISLTSIQLNAMLASFIWPLFRILGLIATDPIFGNRSIPMRAKIALSMVLAFILGPLLGPIPQVPVDSVAGIFIAIQQILIGVAMGFVMRIVFVSVEMAGSIIGLQMGLGFATFFDPQSVTPTPVIGGFTGLLTALVFLAIDGHLMVIAALVESFRELPISAQPMASEGWRTIVRWGGQIFTLGVWISLPVAAALLITNMAIGIMTRAAPQLNIFAIGFPLTLAVGFLVLMLSLPYFSPILERISQEGVQMILQFVKDAKESGR